MKRVWAIAIVFILMVSLCGCVRTELSEQEKKLMIQHCESIVKDYVKEKGYKIVESHKGDEYDEEEDEDEDGILSSDYVIQMSDDWFIEVDIYCLEKVFVTIQLENTAYYAYNTYWDDDWYEEWYEEWVEDEDEEWEDDDEVWNKELNRRLRERFTINRISQVRDEDVESVLELYNAMGRKKHSVQKIVDYVHRFDGEQEETDSVSFLLSDWNYGFVREEESGYFEVCLSLRDCVNF